MKMPVKNTKGLGPVRIYPAPWTLPQTVTDGARRKPSIPDHLFWFAGNQVARLKALLP